MSSRARSGFTLAEVVVAVVVLELGLVGALSLVVLAARTLDEARRLEAAVAVAEGLADSLEAAEAIVVGSGSRSGRPARWAPEVEGFVVRVQVVGDDTLELRGAAGPGG